MSFKSCIKNLPNANVPLVGQIVLCYRSLRRKKDILMTKDLPEAKASDEADRRKSEKLDIQMSEATMKLEQLQVSQSVV